MNKHRCRRCGALQFFLACFALCAVILGPTIPTYADDSPDGECVYGQPVHFLTAALGGEPANGLWIGAIAVSSHLTRSASIGLKFSVPGEKGIIKTAKIQPNQHNSFAFDVQFSQQTDFILVELIRGDGELVPGQITIYKDGRVEVKC